MATSALVGTTLDGKFRLDEMVGAGSMGTVFRATQLTLGKTVAIKVMKKDLGREETYASRFKREAKAASRLDHPNSLRVLDFGDDDGLLYIAMEYIGGRDLLTLLSEEWPLAAPRIVELMSQTLAALAVAHEMGIVHRDLKPENVMVLRGKDDEGEAVEQVKVCDFGVAKLLPDAARERDAEGNTMTGTGTLTAAGSLIGTPEYMSPEQVSALPLDARSDIYSLGVILYQLLTRRLPFEDKNAVRLAMKQIEETPRKPSELVPAVNARLEAICLKALEKAPEKRFASAREMRAELRAVMGERGAPASQVEAMSTKIIPQGAMSSGDQVVLSAARTLVQSKPPPAPPPTSTATEAGAMARSPTPTVTEPSALQRQLRRRRTWLAIFAIAAAVALLIALAR